MGNIAPGTLYRSSSPIDPGQGDRRFVADALVKEAGVAAAVNVSDCRLKFRGFAGFDDTYYATLEQVALNMGHDYPSRAFLEDVRNGMDFLGEYSGPYLIHGTVGAERTGYFCMILEALMGGTKDELVEDYLRSYRDYYRLTPEDKNWPELEARAVNDLLTFTGATDEAALEGLDLAQAARRYLVEQVYLTEGQVDALVTNLSGK